MMMIIIIIPWFILKSFFVRSLYALLHFMVSSFWTAISNERDT